VATAAVGSVAAGAAGTGRGSGTPQGLEGCPTGTLCVWTQPRFTGAMTQSVDGGTGPASAG
jgi:hypothetical protein